MIRTTRDESMFCICKTSMTQLQLKLPLLGFPAPGIAPPAAVTLPSLAQDIQALAAWLASQGLPAPAWVPDPVWIGLKLPALPLPPAAMATISAFAQLRASVQAQLGIDLAVPGQAAGFVQMVLSLQARLNALVAKFPSLGAPVLPLMPMGAPGAAVPSAMSWSVLAALMNAAKAVLAALTQGLLPVPPIVPPHLPPHLPPLGPFRPFLAQMHPLLPVIAASSQLGINLSENITAQLAPMLKVMAQIKLPAFSPPALNLLANLTGTLSSVAQLSAGLNVDPLALGMAAIRQMVGAMLAELAKAIEAALGTTPAAIVAQLPLLPKPAFSPALMITAPVVQAAMAINAPALAALTWPVPAVSALPVLSVGLPAISMAAQMQAALGVSVAAAPCMAGCDAAALLAAVG